MDWNHHSLTLLAGVPGEAPCAGAPAVDALAAAAAVGDDALVVAQLALAALPARVAPARPILVVAVAGAQHGADAWKRGGMVNPMLKEYRVIQVVWQMGWVGMISDPFTIYRVTPLNVTRKGRNLPCCPLPADRPI